MKDNRPVNLDLMTLKYPLAAITSLLHRISGAFIFIGVALLLYILDLSLQSEAGFTEVETLLSSTLMKLIIWAVLAGLLYHLIAGIKHLLMDMGIGETLEGALRGAQITLVLFVISVIITGLWIW